MTDQAQTNGGDEPRREQTPEELEVRARHRQELTRIELEHELEMRRLDHEAFKRMPIGLRSIFDPRFRDLVRAGAEDMAKAEGFTPKHLLGNPEACMIVILRAFQWNLDPYAVAMSTFVTPDGKIGHEGKLVRAIVEHSGDLVGVIRQEYYGDWHRLPRPSFKMVEKPRRDGRGTYQVPEPAWEYWSEVEHGLGVRITATLRETGEDMALDFDLVDAYPRNATTWPTRPKLQLLNPAIRTFANQVRPSLIMGIPLADHPADFMTEMRDVTPARGREADGEDPMERVKVRTQERYRSGADTASQDERSASEGDGDAAGKDRPSTASKSTPEATSRRGRGRPSNAEMLERRLGEIAACETAEDLEAWERQTYKESMPNKDEIDAALAKKREALAAPPEPVVVLGKQHRDWNEALDHLRVEAAKADAARLAEIDAHLQDAHEVPEADDDLYNAVCDAVDARRAELGEVVGESPEDDEPQAGPVEGTVTVLDKEMTFGQARDYMIQQVRGWIAVGHVNRFAGQFRDAASKLPEPDAKQVTEAIEQKVAEIEGKKR